MIRAKDANNVPSTGGHHQDLRINDLRMRHCGLGRRPISNPTWLSAEGPVVKDPPSARGISVIEYLSYLEFWANKAIALTHRGKALAHKEIPLMIREYSDMVIQSLPWTWISRAIEVPFGSPFTLRQLIVRNLLDPFGIANFRIDVQLC